MFNNDSIKQYAIQAVTGFVTNGESLSLGISKLASENNLQPEQIKRVVEASNTIAHLKLLQSEQKRDFEFPVAKYEDVLGHMVTPSSNTGFVDQTKNTAEQSEAYPGDSHGENVKYASTRAELETYTARAIISTRAHLEKLAYDKQSKMLEIEDSIKRLQKERDHMEKFAEVCSETEFGMIFGMEKSASLNTKLVFEDRELTEARKLVGLIKEAKEIISDEMEKSAFLGAAVGALGRAVGGAIGMATKPIGRGIATASKNLGNISVSKIKGVEPSTAATSWASRAKKVGNTAANIGLGAAFTEHANGSVWSQLQG